MPGILIVAYGNPLRSDDGVAWRAADLLEGRLPGSEILRLHQLTPELSEAIRDFDCVIFIDAAANDNSWVKPGTIRVEEIITDSIEPSRFSHAFSPQRIVGMAEQLYGAHPRAFVVTVTGACFDHGSAVSAEVSNALPELIATIERVARQFLA